MAKIVKPRRLDDIRNKFLSIQAEANKKARELENSGLASYSRAYQDALNTFGSYRKKANAEDEMFDVYDTSRYREIKREAARMQKFINDSTSTIEGVKEYIAAEKYSKAFSGKWYEKYGVSYDLSRVDEEKAKIAFSIYRRIEEDGSSYEKVLGAMGYGSENLIMQIYDMVVDSGMESIDETSMQYWSDYGTVLEKAQKILDREYEKKSKKADEIIENGDIDSVMLLDIIARNPTSKDFWNYFNF